MARTVDYRSFSSDGKAKPEDGWPNGLSRAWWTLKDREAADSIAYIINHMAQHQGLRLGQAITAARLYGDLSLLGLGTLQSTRTNLPATRERVTYNVVQSAIDTITSKLGKNKPKPLYLTKGGDYRLQRKAKKLTRFTEGVFHENEAYTKGVLAFRDALVMGDGIMHVYAHNGRVKWERVLCTELWVDEVEGFYGEPRQMHRVKDIDRAVLLESYPDTKEFPNRQQIIRDNAGVPLDQQAQPTVSDRITVRESWHLPDNTEATRSDPKGGRHVITIDGGILFDEPWTRQFFPFARYSWTPRLFGFWSKGAAEQLQGIQLEINKLLWVIQRSHHLAGSFKVLIENSSKVVTEQITNDVGAIIRYTGQNPPQYVVPPTVQPEIYQHLQVLVQKAFEIVGVSMLSAMSQKPAGLNSGVALREYNDIETDRFATAAQAYERFFMELGKLSIAAVEDAVEGRRSYKVNVPAGRSMETIDWKDVKLPEDSYVLQCFPISSLPDDPAGRLQTVQEFVQAGFITPRQAKKLMDFPDLEQINSLQGAAEEYLTKILDGIVEDGVMTPPEPYDDLTLARELALEYYQQGKVQGLDEDRLGLLRTFLAQITGIENTAKAEAQAQAAPPGAPMAQPSPGTTTPQVPPVPPQPSPLVQNQPGLNPQAAA